MTTTRKKMRKTIVAIIAMAFLGACASSTESENADAFNGPYFAEHPTVEPIQANFYDPNSSWVCGDWDYTEYDDLPSDMGGFYSCNRLEELCLDGSRTSSFVVDFYCASTYEEACSEETFAWWWQEGLRPICEGNDNFASRYIRDCVDILLGGSEGDDTCAPNIEMMCEVCPRTEYLKEDPTMWFKEDFYWDAVQGCLDDYMPECSHLI